MHGLRALIRDQIIPVSWYTVMKKHKCLQRGVEYIYQSIPPSWKGRNYKDGAKYLRDQIRSGITLYTLICRELPDKQKSKWYRLSEIISDLEESWK